MRKSSLVTLFVFLVGTSFSLGQSPGGVERPAATESAAAAEAVKKIVGTELPPLERPVTPYWPSPLGVQPCQPTGLLPGAPSATGPGDCTEVFWASAELLFMWSKKGPLSAPLVTTGSTTGLGALNSGDTTVLFGNKSIDFNTYTAGRFTTGVWFGRGSEWGMEGSFFLTDRQPKHFTAVSDVNGSPLLARPVFDSVQGVETALLISDPGAIAGNVTVNASSRLFGWEVSIVNGAYKTKSTCFELIAGFRSVHLDEDLAIIQNSMLLPGSVSGFAGTPFSPPGGISITDRFDNRNDFYGAQVGARVEYNGGMFYVNASAKVGIGDSHEVANVTGITEHFPFSGASTAVPGGLLALTTNSGRSSHDMFAVVPEVGVNIGYQINPLFRVFVGYNFLYWSDVVRPGDQISRTVNPNFVPVSQSFGQIGGAPQPLPRFERTDFWIQGVNLGMEFRY